VRGLGPTELDEQKKAVNIFFLFTSAFLSSSYLHGYLFFGFALTVKEIVLLLVGGLGPEPHGPP
jgi:hypothetical protein